jgi:molybdopterin molybdotransferase
MTDPCSTNSNGLLSVAQAHMAIQQILKSIRGQERINLHSAVGRISAKPILSNMDIPSECISAMDGYAFNSADVTEGLAFTLTLAGTSWAGKPFTGTLKRNQCIRIFTGAVVPDHADSVIMQETVTTDGSSIQFPADCKASQFVRQPGSDTKKDTLLIAAAKKLSAIDCAMLAANGIFELTVNRKLRIAIFSTGDELKSLGNPLGRGQIYDSNRYALTSLLNDPCYTVDDLGVIPDQEEAVEAVLRNSAKQYDVIISTGGASVGDADFIHQVLAQLGQVNFWKIAMKPGKPLAFGRLGQAFFFGLPGNPASVIATLQIIVQPALQRLCGATERKRIQLQAVCTTSLKKQPGRQEYQRGIVTQLENGDFVVKAASAQDSHQLHNFSRANCYIVLPADCKGVEAGTTVTVEPFDIQL